MNKPSPEEAQVVVVQQPSIQQTAGSSLRSLSMALDGAFAPGSVRDPAESATIAQATPRIPPWVLNFKGLYSSAASSAAATTAAPVIGQGGDRTEAASYELALSSFLKLAVLLKKPLRWLQDLRNLRPEFYTGVKRQMLFALRDELRWASRSRRTNRKEFGESVSFLLVFLTFS
jgi:hypothetical protein